MSLRAVAPRGVQRTEYVDEIYGPVMALSNDFIYQSYFDSTLLQNALLTQAPNQPIVESTKSDETVNGHAIVVHPASEAPVAIDFKLNGAPIIVAKPGQIVRPVGHNPKKSSRFQGFSWGLPFGWLGGGMVQLLVLQSPNSDVWAPGNPEVIFHRARFQVLQPSQLTTVVAAGNFNNAPLNWPRRFPWNNATRVVSSLNYPQKGKPNLSITDCDRVALVLRDKTGGGQLPLAASASVRVIYQQTTDIDMSSTGTFSATPATFEDITFPGWANVGTSGNLTAPNPLLMIDNSSASGKGMLRLNGDSGGIVFVDLTGTGALNGCFIDVVRYGRL